MGHTAQIRLPFKRMRGAAAFAWIAAAFLTSLGVVVVIDGVRHSRIPEIVMGAALVTLVFASIFGMVRTRRSGRGYMELRNDSLVLHDPKLLEHPWEIPIDLIRGALVDSGRPRFRLEGQRRFSIENGSGNGVAPELARWLYSELGGSPLPLIGQNQPPNVAIVFGAPLEIETLRPRRSPWTSTGSFGGASQPTPGEEYRGVLVAVEDPPAVRRFFADKGLMLDALPIAEAERLGATAERERRHRRGLWVALVVMVVVQVGVQTLFFGQNPRRSQACRALERLVEPRTERLFEAAVQRQEPRVNLGDLLVREPPPGFTPTADSWMSLQEAAHSRRDPEEGRRTLRKYEYQSGYFRAWASNDIVAGARVFQFSSPANAFAFHAYAARYACVFSNDAYTVPAIAGSIGLEIRYRDGRITDQISFVRGTRRYLVWFSYPRRPASHQDATELAQRQAQIAS